MRFGRMRHLAAAVALLTTHACTQRPNIRILKPDSVVLAFGDSLTSGVEYAGDKTYPEMLQEILGCKVVNSGVPGEVTAEGVRRLSAVLHRHAPVLVVLCHGGNDMLAGTPDEVIAQNLRKMITMAKAGGADVVMVAPPRPRLKLDTPAFYADVASEFGLPCDTTTLADILSSPKLKADQIHPNSDGNRMLAEAVGRLLRQSEAERR
jgi:acyl-CoA thioesterase I